MALKNTCQNCILFGAKRVQEDTRTWINLHSIPWKRLQNLDLQAFGSS